MIQPIPLTVHFIAPWHNRSAHARLTHTYDAICPGRQNPPNMHQHVHLRTCTFLARAMRPDAIRPIPLAVSTYRTRQRLTIRARSTNTHDAFCPQVQTYHTSNMHANEHFVQFAFMFTVMRASVIGPIPLNDKQYRARQCTFTCTQSMHNIIVIYQQVAT